MVRNRQRSKSVGPEEEEAKQPKWKRLFGRRKSVSDSIHNATTTTTPITTTTPTTTTPITTTNNNHVQQQQQQQQQQHLLTLQLVTPEQLAVNYNSKN
mmetsp:Transcript_29628/g.42011  ORF Transcript_29628/g.42011 Transcript_29628/m.42011 type:complete len:98 (-) Transcript_29628:87-380(-)